MKGRNLEQFIVLSSVLLTQACSPIVPQPSPESTRPAPIPFTEETLVPGVIGIAPQETIQTPNFTFSNDMTDYSVRIDINRVDKVASRYGIPIKFSEKTTVRLLPTVFLGDETDGVEVQIQGSGEQDIFLSGGLFVQKVVDATGRPPADLRDQTFLSQALSITLVSGMAQLAERRGELPKGSAKQIETQYLEDCINLKELFVAGMQILQFPPPPGLSS